MKRFFLFFLLAALCFSFSSCSLLKEMTAPPGNTDQVKTTIGDSLEFSEAEITSAINVVLKKFVDFEGCTMTDIWYDEGWSKEYGYSFLSDILDRYELDASDTVEIIVLRSNFDTDSSQGGHTGFESNATYTAWNWILY